LSLTDEQAAAMMAELARHFGEPVRRVSTYCKALETWAGKAVEAGIISLRSFSEVRMGIEKSCLLARLIYGGEELRERPCPEHRGEWKGIEWRDPKTGEGNVCPHGCGLTGWLPNEAAASPATEKP
jgi:hypothetical protein